ncbi:hypothetical protein EIP91_000804 [Steccherinum ochraceum]|uniref:F-box domain-containing protein n=1 Tax=Steccherinum ochraceum TaxID=92696 RepID=A0A4R0RF09_9APHY|nr:hypothetical protein EIP91_000804 [Steccherinum ochraceum]
MHCHGEILGVAQLHLGLPFNPDVKEPTKIKPILIFCDNDDRIPTLSADYTFLRAPVQAVSSQDVAALRGLFVRGEHEQTGQCPMQLSLETYSLIVNYVADRENLASLCRASKTFQKLAERKLYHSLDLRGIVRTTSMCRLLAITRRLSVLVEALSIRYSEDDSADSDESGYHVPDDYWDDVANALRTTTELKHLNVYIETGDQAAQSWVLNHCTFQLHSFHCDFSWDDHLASFLNTQTQLSDLYLLDFRNDTSDTHISSLDDRSMPKLSTLECTFMDAAATISPGRPISRLKTCFSRSRIEEKRTEMTNLFTKLRTSRKSLRTLDIADSAYTAEFSTELLNIVVNTVSNLNNLRYLGTLVLPVGGRERIAFYGSLMRLHKLQCIEVEVSDWEPPPTSPAALRALTLELRIYCPSIQRVIFVQDFDRTVMKMTDDFCVVDDDVNVETLWRSL